VVNALNAAIVRGLRTSDVRERLAADGSEAVGSSPADFERHIATEIARFRRVIREAAIRAE
jgi:tripartite-type tricarboxylate transporter receptor subunit TctC